MALLSIHSPSVMGKIIRHGFHAVVLVAVAIGVVGILWNRELRTAELMRREEPDGRDSLLEPLGTFVSRERLPYYLADLKLPVFPKAANCVEETRSLLRKGATYDVTVKGGVVACQETGSEKASLARHIAYMFEMKYRRTIEQNDGRRIVERRSFQTIRMAKIVSQASDMELDLASDERLALEKMGFPHPDAGMTIATATDVANAMLVTGRRSVAEDPSSRAFLEQDPMSGRSVRLTYLDGVGVESLEPLGWKLTARQAFYLFCQPVLPTAVLPSHAASGQPATVEAVKLCAFLEPLRFPHDELFAVIEATGSGVHHNEVFSIARLPDVCGRAEHAPDRSGSECRPEPTRMGTIKYDAASGVVASAHVNWCLLDLERTDDQLLYERDFNAVPTMAVYYCCKAS